MLEASALAFLGTVAMCLYPQISAAVTASIQDISSLAEAGAGCSGLPPEGDLPSVRQPTLLLIACNMSGKPNIGCVLTCSLLCHWMAKQEGSVRSTIAAVLLLAGALTAAANIWGIGPINARIQTQVGPQVAHVLGREVSMGKVNWLAPTGVTGVHPIVSVGPVSLGPGAAEGSWAYLPEVRVSMDPVKSLIQHKLVLHLHAPAAEVESFSNVDYARPYAMIRNISGIMQVDLVQASNLSWFGYPEDPVPSARSFLPGLDQVTSAYESGSASEAGAQAQLQAQARQALRQQQRNDMVTPPDAAANFSPAVGKDIISEGYMRPRLRVKPTFPQAAPSVQHTAHSQSSAAAIAPAVSAPADIIEAQDAYAERRASGQSAGTSGPSHEQPSGTRLSRGRSGRRNGSNAPFASITLGHGHNHFASHSTQTEPATASTYNAGTGLSQLPAVSEQSAAPTDVHLKPDTTTTLLQAPVELQANHPEASLSGTASTPDVHSAPENEVMPSSSSYHPIYDNNVRSDKDVDILGSCSSHTQRRPGPSAFPPMPHEAYAYSSASTPATLKSVRAAPSAFPQLPHEAHAYSLFAQRDQPSFVYKPGPSAFPQPPHEAVMQATTAVHNHAPQHHANHGLHAETPQQQPAVEVQEAAGEHQLARDQSTQQGAVRQYAKSQHGGYMQREGHERTSHRRTTRSMLRGADVLTGIPMDPGLATYHSGSVPSQTYDTAPAAASVVQEQVLHNSESTHQAAPDATADRADAIPVQSSEAATKQDHSHTISTTPHQQGTDSTNTAHDRQQSGTISITHDQEDRDITGRALDQQAIQKLQQAFAKTKEVGKMAVDQIQASPLVNDMQARGKAAIQHVSANAPDLGPLNQQLHEVSQVVLQQTQAASTKAQQIGKSSFQHAYHSAVDVSKTIPWDSMQPPSWLPGVSQQSSLAATYADSTPFVQQHYSTTYRPARGVYATDVPAILSPFAGQAQVADALSAQESALPAYRWHSTHQHHHLASLPKASHPNCATVLFTSTPAVPVANCTFVQSDVQLPGTTESSAVVTDLCLHTDVQGQIPDQASTLGNSESANLRDLSVAQLASAEPDSGQEPATPATNGSARYGWDRTGRLVGDGLAVPHYKPGVPHTPKDAWFQRWLGQWGKALLDRVGVPEVALNSFTVRDGQINMWVAGESVPRQFEQTDYTVSLGCDYQDLDFTLTAVAHEWDPSQAKCTMLNPAGTRHLRGVTGTSQASPGSNVPPVRQSEEVQVQQATAFQHEHDESQQTGSTWQRHRPQRQRPTGGKFQLRAHSDGLIKSGDIFPDLNVTFTAQDLHAPLCERLVELPVDITAAGQQPELDAAGRLNGEFGVRCHDAASWKFPSFSGQMACNGIDFHFWDAVDDLSNVDMTLVFDDQRMYMHNASGMFGSIPLTLSGDVGINPDSGQYRLSGEVAGVELNELRKTLAIRPTPYSVGGAVRGVLHVSGPLDQPIFSGTAVATEPTAAMLRATEDCVAKSTMQSTAGAVGAYDKLPLASASCLFTMDTSTDIFVLHSFQAEPMGGGQMMGSGRMWLAPAALEDPRAVRMTMTAQGLPTEAIVQRYIPQGFTPPAYFVLGPGDVKGSMEGSHLNPVIQATWQVPAANASGHVKLNKDTMQFSSKAPALDFSSTLHVRAPPLEVIKAAVTQAEVTAASVPVLEGAEVDANFKELDIMPFVSPGSVDNAPGQAQKLKLTGHTQLSGRLSSHDNVKIGNATGSFFEGEVALNGLRVNQVELSRQLAGTFQFSNTDVHIHAKGGGVDEALDIDLALPLFQPQPAPAPKQPSNFMKGILGPHLGGVADMLPVPDFTGARRAAVPQKPLAPAVLEGGTFGLRCGDLNITAQVNGSSSVVDAAVMGLQLDDLELESLRGELKEVSLSVNFDTRMGRAVVNVEGPRFSGLQGEALSGVVRWERDVIRLDKAVLQQAGSSYKVHGEYIIPPDTHIPDSAASMAQLPPTASPMDLIGPRPEPPPPPPRSAYEQALGRWRLQVSVDRADIEEISPVAPLLNRAAILSSAEYSQAKNAFLQGLQSAGMQAQGVMQQLEDAWQKGNAEIHSNLMGSAAISSPGHNRELVTDQTDGRASTLGWQDVKGNWSGSLRAYGGGGGASNVDFDIEGQDWQYPLDQRTYRLDEVVATGSCHSLEGLKLDQLAVRADKAMLMVQGDLLGPVQNARVQISDFPVEQLQPVFRSMPLLKDAPAASHAAPLMTATQQGPNRAINSDSNSTGAYDVHARSPVQGLLNVRGSIGGSATVPEGTVHVELCDGRMGTTKLEEATVDANLDSQQRFTFTCHLVPTSNRQSGYVHLDGSMPVVLDWMPAVQDVSASIDAIMPSDFQQALDGDTPEAEVAEYHDKIQDLGPSDISFKLDVKDAGMMLVNTIAPDFGWDSGQADVSASVIGHQEQPAVTGKIAIKKATVKCSKIEAPLTAFTADVILVSDQLQGNVSANAGKKGSIKVEGKLPLAPPNAASAQADTVDGNIADVQTPGMNIEIKELKLKMQPLYSGKLDAKVLVQRSLLQPEVSGNIKLSKADAIIPIQGASSPSSDRPAAMEFDPAEVTRAFEALRVKRDTELTGLIRHPSIHAGETQQAELVLVQPAVAESISLKDLTIDFDDVYASILSSKVAQVQLFGQVHATGPADPNELHLTGTIKLERGEVNLLATVFKMDREHSNTLTFSGNALNPEVNVRFKAPGLSARVQSRASVWHSNVIITSTAGAQGGAGVSAAEGKEQIDQLDADQAAKLFEASLASGLVADDGQLALLQLFKSNVDSTVPQLLRNFMSMAPQGQVGQIRWKAKTPFTVDGTARAFAQLADVDMAGIASSLTNGAELQVDFGKSLQATMARKFRSSGDNNVGTEWALNYQLHPHLRMTFHISASTPYPRSVFFHWNSEAMPRLPSD